LAETPPHIGTLNEGPLHEALKALYVAEQRTRTTAAETEVPIGGYVADVRAGDDVIFEIQTGGFGPLKRKLERLLQSHRVVLVYPVAQVRYILKLAGESDTPARPRRSPKRGSMASVVEVLVSIPALLNHPNFELEVVLIAEEEIRVFDPTRVRRRNGWRVVNRRLLEVLERHRFRSAEDLWTLAPGTLPVEFTTADLAVAMQHPRWLAQKLAYCLREARELEICGKEGNALRYRRVDSRPVSAPVSADLQ
jgi:hypothetical protein